MTLEQIITRLQKYQPTIIENVDKRQAAVAMLLTANNGVPEVLFIRRAEYDGDPWSGDIAFPGGGIEAQDANAQAAAERETREEIGLRLQRNTYLGRLDDLKGAYLPVQISCFVYLLDKKPQFKLNGEVVDTFWMPLEELLSPQRRHEKTFEFRGTMRTNPIIEMDGYCDHFLWGITYRLLENFFNLLGCQPQSLSKEALG
ncbi:ADP-ribose pyrophosphatase YjhB, NUDIX family [Malonomonas rubra DSM 5091]|uniref:ADP-ribose pyrophosphatase YjhB, NUDIX family n=1 Tax=Malonomonas rubra DSM 5091 TaxID=1122189 RepID=A0A1M6JGH1_MALRU|nr:CoA pyrophosphatase [Malonomonas rubra]SHJ45682.1 ADP-ribose pyrophosphatase YjhB, NUDIX family [Malonomonas rubra DSM 5091]